MPQNFLVSPEEDEDVARQQPGSSWSDVEWQNFNALRAITPTKKAAVVVCMRNDGVSIIEWVAHYRALGFDGIFVYSNDNTDGSEGLLHNLADCGVITYIENKCPPNCSPQVKAFEHSLRRLAQLREFEWVFYADSDEFLVLDGSFRGIGDVLEAVRARYKNELPTAICYRWKWMLSGYVFRREMSKLLLRRFEHSRPHSLFKSIVRLGNVRSMRILHFPEVIRPSVFVGSDLEPINGSEKVATMWDYRARTPDYTGGHIRHFWTKSFQEFAVKKGRGDNLKLDRENAYKRDFGQFFDWNGLETLENCDPAPPGLCAAVDTEISFLLTLPGISGETGRLNRGFETLLSAWGGSAGLQQIYAREMGRRPEPALPTLPESLGC